MSSGLPNPEKLSLSRQARSLWGKSDGVECSRWLPLYMHMLDSAGIAEHLWDDWLPEGTCSFLTEALGGEPRQARKLACFIAGVHDIGKATPSFQGMPCGKGALRWSIGHARPACCLARKRQDIAGFPIP